MGTCWSWRNLGKVNNGNAGDIVAQCPGVSGSYPPQSQGLMSWEMRTPAMRSHCECPQHYLYLTNSYPYIVSQLQYLTYQFNLAENNYMVLYFYVLSSDVKSYHQLLQLPWGSCGVHWMPVQLPLTRGVEGILISSAALLLRTSVIRCKILLTLDCVGPVEW